MWECLFEQRSAITASYNTQHSYSWLVAQQFTFAWLLTNNPKSSACFLQDPWILLDVLESKNGIFILTPRAVAAVGSALLPTVREMSELLSPSASHHDEGEELQQEVEWLQVVKFLILRERNWTSLLDVLNIRCWPYSEGKSSLRSGLVVIHAEGAGKHHNQTGGLWPKPPNYSGFEEASLFLSSLWTDVLASVHVSLARPLGNKTFTVLPYLSSDWSEFLLWKWFSLTFRLCFHTLCTAPQEVVQSQNGAFVPTAGSVCGQWSPIKNTHTHPSQIPSLGIKWERSRLGAHKEIFLLPLLFWKQIEDFQILSLASGQLISNREERNLLNHYCLSDIKL